MQREQGTPQVKTLRQDVSFSFVIPPLLNELPKYHNRGTKNIRGFYRWQSIFGASDALRECREAFTKRIENIEVVQGTSATY